MLAGLQGSGKTTLAGKLSKWLKDQGHTPLLVAADLQRPNAVTQLEVVGSAPACRSSRLSAATSPATTSSPRRSRAPAPRRPGGRLRAGVEHARRAQHDVVIVDTAGRLAIDANLMQQAADIRAAIQPDEVLFVIDAMIGQAAVETARPSRTGSTSPVSS
jgi:signal recognition particle subunit SRP54